MKELELLTPTVILLCIGFLVIFACRFMRISPIIGFLIAGLVIGPHGMDWIEDTPTTHLLAELGVVFLLFDIGLHFSTKSAWKLRKDLFGLAPLQMLITGIILASTLKFIFGISGDFALLAGFALALSSTAVVMQIIGDLKQTESPVGQSGKAVLIFQDLVAIFLLIFADAVGSGENLTPLVIGALSKTVLAFIAAIVLGQYILSPLMKLVIKYDDPEMFTVLGLAIVMLTALTTASAGLSLTLGAFLAGMVLAETPFRVLLQSELRPFRSLLIAFFFMTIGMMLEPAVIVAQGDIVLGFLALLISVKAAIIGALTFIFRKPAHHAIQLSFLLAQGSEFAFVIFAMASVSAGMGSAISQQL
ncbi:MAG: cation:proton antiporter, partial [Alphaproteobacteria bacterium]